MKVKNIMFAGFAAAIFAGVAGAANAATYNLASKEYVEAEDAKVLADAKAYADEKDALDEKLTNKAATGTNLDGKDLDTMYPTVAKVQALDDATLKSANDYTDEKIEDIETGIGTDYQKLSERVATTTQVAADADKDALYPTLAKTEALDATTLQSANTYTDEEIAKLDADEVKNDAGFISSVSETDGKVTAVATAFETVIDDTTKDSAIAPQTAAVKTYVDAQDAATLKSANDYTDAEIEKIETGIGSDYQKLEEKLTSGDTREINDTNKDTLYPTVGKVQALDAAALQEAKDYADGIGDDKQDKLTGTANTVNFVQTDANGNVTALVGSVAVVDATGEKDMITGAAL